MLHLYNEFPYIEDDSDEVKALYDIRTIRNLEWNQTDGITYNDEDTVDNYRRRLIGWIHYIWYDENEYISVMIQQGIGTNDYYMLAFDKMFWFGADYNPEPAPHPNCGIFQIAQSDIENIIDNWQAWRAKTDYGANQ